ncbi:hypothetical protein D3C78_1516000 [compost metagenome]
MEILRSDLFQLRNNSYFELLQISEQQLDFIQRDNWADAVDEMNALFNNWTRKKEELDKINMQIDEMSEQLTTASDSVIETFNIEASSIMERIIEIRSIIENEIKMQFHTLSKSMKSVKDQQVILNAYYGVRRRNDIPIYFDEKK